jgi:hypothetical protein
MNVKHLDQVSCGLNPRTGRPRVIASTDSVDAMNDVIVQAGLEITPPIRMLLNHDYLSLPVGLIPDAASVHRGAHRTEVEFDFFEGDVEIARVANLYRQGGFDASVGFRIVKASPNEHGGLTITESVLHEVSLTATPANRDCQAVVRGLLGARGVTSCPAALLCPNDTQAEFCPAGAKCPQSGNARTSWRDERTVRIIDDREPVWRVDPAQFAQAWQMAVADVMRETYNRLKGRVD